MRNPFRKSSGRYRTVRKRSWGTNVARRQHICSRGILKLYDTDGEEAGSTILGAGVEYDLRGRTILFGIRLKLF
ncbi:MAG: hypothetical protein LKK19_01915 [Bacteroidales bacterium]|jgi:hypothetical protein|nr:hypothetical protein [Bacteroidales bacterium]MCI2145866.1 hypothetical protein [Bacteroidales bacterium]